MKTLKLNILICLSLLASVGFSQNFDVTFRVNMQNEVGVTEVSVFGAFNAWDAASGPALTNIGGTTWEGIASLPSGANEFKFVANTGEESLTEGSPCTVTNFGFTNRFVDVTAATTLDLYCFGQCVDCAADIEGCTDMNAQNYNDLAVSDNGSCTYLLTVSVDMTNVAEGFTIPELNGGFNSWCGSCWPLSDNGDGTWTGTFAVPNGAQEYKFAADNWNIQEDVAGAGACTIGNNRLVQINGDTTVDVVCWGSCEACPPPASDVRITAVDPSTGDLTLTNIGNDVQDMTTWFLCNAPMYQSVSALMGGDPLLGAGEALSVNWASINNIVDGEVGLYSSNTGYSNPDNVVDYMEWGSTGHTRSATAVSAGVWNTGDFVEGATPFSFTGTQGNYGSMFWAGFVNTKNITFTVDMSNEAISAMGAHFAGGIQGWDPAGSIMTNNTDGTWSITFAMEEGQTYEYTYINGNDWPQQESVPSECGVDNGNGGFNRTYTVGATDEVLPTVCFSACEACPLIIAGCTDPLAQNYDDTAEEDNGSCTYLLTVTVDMSEVVEGFTTPELNGGFNGWCGSCNPLTDNGDGTWTGTFAVPNGQQEYKFSADSWNIQEDVAGAGDCTIGNNRFVQVDGDTTVDVVCWGSCFDCGVLAGCMDEAAQNYDATATVENGSCTYLLTVTVNMSEVVEGFTTPELNGGFNGWCGSCNPLTDNGDGTWSGTFVVPNGQQEYKFSADTWTIQEDVIGAGDCALGANRVVQIDGDTTVDVVCWGSCFDCGIVPFGCTDPAAQNYEEAALEENGSCTYLLTVTVNMSEVVEGFTTPELNGTFNGWSGGMNPLSDNGDGTWTGTVTVTNGMQEYKFAADAWNIQEDVAGAGDCTIGNNRFVQVDGDTTVDVVCWGSCYDCGALVGCMDPAAQNYDDTATIESGNCTYLLTVTVNMADVMETFIAPEINGNFNGWNGGQNPLTDNGDGTWTATVVVPTGQVEYKFAADSWAIQEDLAGITGCVVDFNGNWNRVIQINGDTTVDVVCWGSCENCPGPVEGCTDPLYTEFNPYAEVENGSCVTLVVEGCAYEAADNYDPNANTDNETCVFSANDCPGDFNGDDAITIVDLSGFLGAFGTLCD